MLQKEERTCGAADVRTVLQARYILTNSLPTPEHQRNAHMCLLVMQRKLQKRLSRGLKVDSLIQEIIF